MYNRKILLTLLCFATLLPAILAGESRQPNVVLILCDDLGYGDVSSYGQSDYQTPQIDKLATEGVKATDFYVVVPYCAPSRASLLTGRFPLRNGMTRNPHPDEGSDEMDNRGISADELLLGEVYQRAGYKTIAIGKWHLGHKERFYPTRHGFDEYYGILYSNDMLPVQIMSDEQVSEYPVDQRYLTKKYTQKAIETIETHKNQPFFLYLPHAMPHKPIAASEDFYTPDTPKDLYHDVIRELDWSVGEVVKSLRDNGILENTIVIFMSDNGPHHGGSTGGLKGKKATEWEGGTRVPFIIRYPSELPMGKVIKTPMWSVDLFPTLLNMCGIPVPQDRILDGEDIQAILKGESTAHGPVYTMTNETIATIRDGDWKLFLKEPRYLASRDLNPDFVDPKAPDGVHLIAQTEQPSFLEYPGIVPERFEKKLPLLFNLSNDRTESEELSDKYPEVVKRLQEEYEKFLGSMPKASKK